MRSQHNNFHHGRSASKLALGLLLGGGLLALGLWGCGGSAGDGGVVDAGATTNPFGGTYVANYSKGPTDVLTIAVAADGSARIAVGNSLEGDFVGAGTVSQDGGLSGTALQQEGPGSVTVTGQFTRQDGTARATGSVSGSVTIDAWAAEKVAGVGINAFAGNYAGSYDGDDFGTWEGGITVSGDVTARAESPLVGTISFTGTVSPVGVGTLAGSGSSYGPDSAIEWKGVWRWVPDGSPICYGTWQSSDGTLSGTFEGARTGGATASHQRGT